MAIGLGTVLMILFGFVPLGPVWRWLCWLFARC